MVSAQLVGIMAAIAAAQARIAAMQAHNDWCLQVGDSGLYPEEAFSAEAEMLDQLSVEARNAQ